MRHEKVTGKEALLVSMVTAEELSQDSLKSEMHFLNLKNFIHLRVQPPAGNYYTTESLRDSSRFMEKHGSGLVTFHGQTGNIMFIGSYIRKHTAFL
jgi:dissimilatory sulfite reductase (desulfoviridin) alpha/beta subunit